MDARKQKLAKYLVYTVFIIVILTIIVKAVIDHSEYQYPPEAYAIGNLRSVENSQQAFSIAEGGYASTFKELRDDQIAAGQPAYLDIDFSGIVQGYRYTLKPAGVSRSGYNGLTVYMDYECIAEPVEYKEDSNRSFYVDSSGVIRAQVGKVATKDSEPL